MMRDTAAQTASHSKMQQKPSAPWYSLIRSAIFAGFEAYGSAQIGMAPSSFTTTNPDRARAAECRMKSAGCTTGNQPVAEGKSDPVSIRPGKLAVYAAWSNA